MAVNQVWVFGFGSINCFVNYYLDLVLSVSYNCSPYTEAPPCDSKKDTRRSTLPHDAEIPSRRRVFMGRRMPVDTASSRNDVNRPGCRVAENVPAINFLLLFTFHILVMDIRYCRLLYYSYLSYPLILYPFFVFLVFSK